MSEICKTQSSMRPAQSSAASAITSPLLVSSMVQRRRISLTETYSVATTCRSKLGREAGRKDHELRLLVGHANMLDRLMDELMEAEREQEGRINALIRSVPEPQQPCKVQWIDNIAKELEEADNDSDSNDDSDDDSDLEEDLGYKSPLYGIKSPPPTSSSGYFDEDYQLSDEDGESDEEDDDSDLSLQRWPSHLRVPEATSDTESNTENDEQSSTSSNDAGLACMVKQCSIGLGEAQAAFNMHVVAGPLALVVAVK